MKLFDGEASMFLENSKVREVISEKQRSNGGKKQMQQWKELRKNPDRRARVDMRMTRSRASSPNLDMARIRAETGAFRKAN